MNKSVDEILFKQIGQAIEQAKAAGLSDEVCFYEQLRHAIELKGIASIKDYIRSNVTYNYIDKVVLDFLVDLEKVTIECAALNLDERFDLAADKTYYKNSLLATVSCSINQMLEEIKYRTIPKSYFEEMFDLTGTLALLTDMSGKILVVSNPWKYRFGKLPVGEEIHTILPDALYAMLRIQKNSSPYLIKNTIIFSPEGEKVKGYDVKLKVLRNHEKNDAPECYLFVFSPASDFFSTLLKDG